MSDFSLKYEGVIVPPDVEALGPAAVVDYVKRAPNAPVAPAVLAAIDASLADHERRYPQRAALERARLAAAKAAAQAAQPVRGAGAPVAPVVPPSPSAPPAQES